MWDKTEIAKRAAKEVKPGSIVNLGIGLPTLVADQIAPDDDVWLHSENGLLGMGPFPFPGEEDPHLINAGKQTVTVVPGGSFFDSAASFGMIRGGHVDLAILGAMQVSSDGDIANWAVPGGKLTGIGGAMDLAASVKDILVLMQHCTKEGQSKLMRACTYPLTAKKVVRRIITELGIFEPRVSRGGFALIELASGVSEESVRGHTPIV